MDPNIVAILRGVGSCHTLCPATRSKKVVRRGLKDTPWRSASTTKEVEDAPPHASIVPTPQVPPIGYSSYDLYDR